MIRDKNISEWNADWQRNLFYKCMKSLHSKEEWDKSTEPKLF